MDQVEREVQRRQRILDHAEESGNVAKTLATRAKERKHFGGIGDIACGDSGGAR